jgi:CheY-like chemotaxis protein
VDRLNPSPLFECAQIAAKSRRILIAEDNAVNQKIAVRLLEKCGCRVDLAANGREAVEMAGRFPYDLIFMDCGMPEMDTDMQRVEQFACGSRTDPTSPSSR